MAARIVPSRRWIASAVSQGRVQLGVADYHDAVVVAHQDVAGVDLDVSKTYWLLRHGKPGGSGRSGNRAERVDGQRQLGQGRGVAAQSVDDDAGHLASDRLGGEEFTEHCVFGGPGIDDQDVAGAALLQTGEHGHQVAGGGDRNGPADHTDATRVRAKLAWQDAQRLVRVRETRGVELPHPWRDRATGHRAALIAFVSSGLPFDLAPATGAIVGDDLPEHLAEGARC